MSGFLKYFIPFALVMTLALAGMFVFGGLTGRACLACEVGTAQKINFANPSPADEEMIGFLVALVVYVPFGGLALFGLMILALRVTASPQQRQDAKMAKEMGEDGVGVWLFGNDK